MNDIKAIIDRMKIAFKIKTNKELANKLGTSLSNIDNWKKRKSIPQKYILLVSQMNNINPDWLLTGEGEMYKSENKVHISGISNSIIGQAGNNNGIVNITHTGLDNNPMIKEIAEIFNTLPKDKQKYYYHKFMADMFEEMNKGK